MASFNSPNPYGSYFNFGDPERLASMFNLPGISSGMTPGVMSAMGSPVGGFNPTRNEYMMSRYRDMAYQQFISDSLSRDARAATFTNAAINAAFGSDTMQKARFYDKIGGATNAQNAVGFLLNMPGVAGHFGGSVQSLALGSLGAATSGLTLNGFGMFGDGPLQLSAARSINNAISSRFYSPSGSSYLSMTQGLNRDQIGGIMTMGAAGGAFAGLDMGKLNNASRQIEFNPSSMKKIENFVKDGAKALSALIDVYGDGSVSELMDKAQSITGLSLNRLGNPQAIKERLTALRKTAEAYGVDAQTAYDISASATQMGMAMGMSREFAGSGAVQATAEAIAISKNEKMAANSGVFFRARSEGEVTGDMMRDRAGLMNDPLGIRRMAIGLMAQNGRFGADTAKVLDLAANATMGNMGALDQEMERRGINLNAYMRAQGGAEKMNQNLTPGTADWLHNANMKDMNSTRNFRAVQAKITALMANDTDDQRAAMTRLFKDLNPESVHALLNGNAASRRELLAGNLQTRNDVAGYMSILSKLDGKAGVAADIVTAVKGDEFARNYVSQQAFKDRADNLDKNKFVFDDEQRGAMRSGIIEGFLQKQGGRDVASAFAMIAKEDRNKIAGLSTRINLNAEDYLTGDGKLDRAAWTNTLKNFVSEMEGKTGGKEVLRELKLSGKDLDKLDDSTLVGTYTNLTAAETRHRIMRNFHEVGRSDRGSMFAANDDIKYKQEHGLDGASMIRLGQMLGDDTLMRRGMELYSGRYTVKGNDGKLRFGGLRNAELHAEDDNRVAYKGLRNLIYDTNTRGNHLAELAQSNGAYAKILSEQLGMAEIAVAGGTDDKMKAHIARLMKEFKAAVPGVGSKTDISFIGTFMAKDDKSLELVGKMSDTKATSKDSH